MLIVYGVADAFACGKGSSPKVSCLSMLAFFVLGVFAALMHVCFSSNPEFVGVPNAPSVYFSYVPFFMYGAVAQRNDWMEKIK